MKKSTTGNRQEAVRHQIGFHKVAPQRPNTALCSAHGIDTLQHRPSPVIKPIPSPNAPKNENVSAGLEGPGSDACKQQTSSRSAKQAEIRTEVQRLFAIATEIEGPSGQHQFEFGAEPGGAETRAGN